jgi:AcrR family transcriptional regulator
MPAIGLRERKKAETRQSLRTAALQLAAERGLDRVTIEDIAAAANVSTRTFFNYFSSKEEAIVGADPVWTAHLLAVLAARPDGEQPLFALEAVFEEFTGLLVDARDTLVMRRKVIADNPALLARHVAAFAEFERVLVEAIRERTPSNATSDHDSALVVAAAVAALRVTVDLWVDLDGTQDLPQLMHHAITRLAAGFSATSAPSKGSTKTPTRTAMRKVLS